MSFLLHDIVFLVDGICKKLWSLNQQDFIGYDVVLIVQVVWCAVESRLSGYWPQVSWFAGENSSIYERSMTYLPRVIEREVFSAWGWKVWRSTFRKTNFVTVSDLTFYSCWWYRFFWIRAGMMGWFLINLSVAAKQYIDQGSLSLSMVLFQGFCAVSFLQSP